MTKLIGSAFDKLVRDFSEIKIEVKPLDLYNNYSYIDEHGNDLSGKEYLYNILFQSDFFIARDSEYPTREYYDYLRRLKNEYYREINDQIENFIDKELVLNDLSNHRLQFEEIKRLYKTDLIESETPTEDNVLHSNVVIVEDSKKPVNHTYYSNTTNMLLRIQLIEIQNIIKFLQEKTEITKTFLETIRQVSKRNKLKEPLKKLDRYQTALLFYYLNETGIIQYKSSNEIAPLVQSLTGHSAHNMQTEAFNKIINVKKGDAGNKIEVKKNRSYNLIKVKNVVLEILEFVNADLEKNKTLQ